MANMSKWSQPAAGKSQRANTRVAQPKIKQYGADSVQSPFGQGGPFSTVAGSQAQAGQSGSLSGMNGSSGASVQEALAAPFIVKPGSVQGMGPYVAGAAPVGGGGGGTWSGGPLGQVPSHRGWGGLKQNTKDWTLRILGAFPTLRFSSGYRTPAQNAAVGGVPNSGHMRGDKIDLSGSAKDMYAAAAWAKRYGAKTLLHDAGSGFHLDISWAGVNS